MGRGTGVPWGATVMATGIVSIGLRLAGFGWAGRALLVLTAALWIVLAVTFGRLLVVDVPATSRPAALTSVAGTGVLGDGALLSGHTGTAAVLLAIATALWCALLPRVLRHLRGPLPGSAYLVTVATQALAVLAAMLATQPGARWLGWPAGVLLAAGLVLYLLVLRRFDLGQLGAGPGDHWVVAGALSISALAAARVTDVAGRPPALAALTLAVLAVALAWYAVLVVYELARRRLHYDGRRWSTVFPLGMTSVSAMTAGRICDVPWLHTLGEILLWPAAIAWLAIALATTHSTIKQQHPN